jgi:hypothetical protein
MTDEAGGHDADEARPDVPRRDVEPHRGDELVPLALASFGLSVVSILLAPLILLGLPFATVVLVMSLRDLRRMRDGLMDPAGKPSALASRDCAAAAMGMALIGVVAWAGGMIIYLLSL